MAKHDALKKHIHLAFKGVIQDDQAKARKALDVVRDLLMERLGKARGATVFKRFRLGVAEANRLARLGKKYVAAKSGLLRGEMAELFREWRFNNEFVITKDKSLARLVVECDRRVTALAKDESDPVLRREAIDALNRISEYLEGAYEQCMNNVLKLHRETFKFVVGLL